MSSHETIAQIKQRLLELDRERETLLSRLSKLEKSTVTPRTSQEKIAVFQSLFQGRNDVFPKRWENQKNKRTGYSPACQNEWIRDICHKPKIKCTDSKHQVFIPVTENVLHAHLTGQDPDNKH